MRETAKRQLDAKTYEPAVLVGTYLPGGRSARAQQDPHGRGRPAEEVTLYLCDCSSRACKTWLRWLLLEERTGLHAYGPSMQAL